VAKNYRRLFAVFKSETVSHSRMFEWCTQYFAAAVNQLAMVTVQVCSCWQRQKLRLHSDWQTCNRLHETAAELILNIGSVKSSENFKASAW